MKSGDIIELINNPDLLNEDSERQLRSLLENYPYFQTARLLYLMNLHTGKDSEFDSELKKTACYAVDRKKLYFLVHGKQFTPIQISRLEKTEKTLQLDSSFDLIDFFLREKAPGTVSSGKNPVIPDNKAGKLISSDYMSYLLSDDVKYNEPDVIPMQHQATIDEFLRKDSEESIKIQLKDPDDPLPEHAGAAFEEIEDGDFFSETLAKIYIRQKKYAKALEIIRKLHLLYPEKNIYFADQIRFLEKLIINIKKA
ncbi:MAG: tetratricopeptide repeat protein [Dysgonamonadaceae bacterium]|jgi:hypothetical protein|nr:tetratricopeptide repeat protein [Dysgonamonadaceae bacterium]